MIIKKYIKGQYMEKKLTTEECDLIIKINRKMSSFVNELYKNIKNDRMFLVLTHSLCSTISAMIADIPIDEQEKFIAAFNVMVKYYISKIKKSKENEP